VSVEERLRLRENFDRFNFAIHKEKEMADFRKWILAFAALVLILGSVAPASAQQNALSCSVSAAVTPNLRHEGFTELVGDILLSCPANPNVPPLTSGPIPQADISVSLSAPITSRILTGNVTEALLLVDDPAPPLAPNGQQRVCPSPDNPAGPPSAGGCQGTADGGISFKGGSNDNVFQGIITGAPVPGTNSITFLGIPVDPPATGNRTYRITNIRIDATGVPAAIAGLSPVNAFVSVSPSSAISITNPQSTVGFVSNSLTVTAPGPSSAPFFQCLDYPFYFEPGSTPGSTSPNYVGTVKFAELFATAFKTRGVIGTTSTGLTYPQGTPGTIYYTESGLEIAVVGGEAGAADTATELYTTINNIPSGTTVWVDSYAVSTASTSAVLSDATMVLPVLATAVPGLAAGSSANPVAVNTTTSNGVTSYATTATVVWSITSTNSFALDTLAFNIYVSFTGAPGTPGTPSPTGVFTTSESGYFPYAAAASSSEAIPTFISNVPQTSPSNLFEVSLCQTILLFPYVTDFYGFDTGIAISNTSLNSALPSIGPSTGQPGGCTVTFYGGGAVATTLGTAGSYSSTADSALTNGIILPGQTWAFSMSSIDPGYNSAPTYGTTGYAIASCNFQYAHGYSFVSDTGIRQFAAAYLALIIPDTTRSAQPFFCSSIPGACYGETGEQLVH